MISLGRNKKGFFQKKANRTAIFIALLASMFLFTVETVVWSIKMTLKQVFNLSDVNTDLYAHPVGIIIAFCFLAFFTWCFSKGIED